MPDDVKDQNSAREATVDDDGKSWERPLRQLRSQQQFTRSPNTQDRGYVRQKANNKLWVRERLDALLDQKSFTEVGSIMITGQPVFDEKTGKLVSFVPANSVTGWGKLDGRKVFVTDFSVRRGHANGGIMNKPVYGLRRGPL